MRANASLAANRTHSGLEKEIKREVAKMLAEAEAVDREEEKLYGDERGDELPVELRTQTTRLQRLRECKARLEREAEARAASQQKKIDERAAKEEATGKKLRGRKPKEPDPTPSGKAKANVAEPENRHHYVRDDRWREDRATWRTGDSAFVMFLLLAISLNLPRTASPLWTDQTPNDAPLYRRGLCYHSDHRHAAPEATLNPPRSFCRWCLTAAYQSDKVLCE